MLCRTYATYVTLTISTKLPARSYSTYNYLNANSTSSRLVIIFLCSLVVARTIPYLEHTILEPYLEQTLTLTLKLFSQLSAGKLCIKAGMKQNEID